MHGGRKKISDFADRTGPTAIGDYKNVAACAIFAHHFDVAEIRICGSNTPPTSGIVGQILPRRSPRVAPTGVATSGWEVAVSPNTEISTPRICQEIANFTLPGGNYRPTVMPAR